MLTFCAKGAKEKEKTDEPVRTDDKDTKCFDMRNLRATEFKNTKGLFFHNLVMTMKKLEESI